MEFSELNQKSLLDTLRQNLKEYLTSRNGTAIEFLKGKSNGSETPSNSMYEALHRNLQSFLTRNPGSKTEKRAPIAPLTRKDLKTPLQDLSKNK